MEKIVKKLFDYMTFIILFSQNCKVQAADSAAAAADCG
jgi:hypothetical protein